MGGKWVYTSKGDPENPIYKPLYIAKWYSQIYGVDFFETSAATVRMEPTRILMQSVVNFDLLSHQMDVRSAYLHAPFKCHVYICQPSGFKKYDNNSYKLVWKLSKSLYGLTQSGRNWHNLFQNFLIELCFVQTLAFMFKKMKRGIVLF